MPRLRAVGVLLVAASFTSCARSTQPGLPSSVQPSSQLHTVSAQPPAHGSVRHIILPNPQLLACRKPGCTQVLPDQNVDGEAVYPWQVLLDFNGNQVIGLTAFYDQPTSMDDLEVAVDERYGQLPLPNFRAGPARIWRFEPEKFIIHLAKADSGMSQVIYLMFDPKHPVSEPVRKKLLQRFDATNPDDFARKMVLDSMTPQSQ